MQKHNQEGLLYYLEEAVSVNISLCSGISIYSIDNDKKGFTSVSMLNTHIVKTDDVPIVKYSSINNEPVLLFKDNHNSACYINLTNITNFQVINFDDISINFCFDYDVKDVTFKYLFSVQC